MSRVREGQEWRGAIGRLTDEEVAEFLGGDVLCRLGCLDEDGWPYVVPVWFEHTGAGFYIIPRARSTWARHIQRDSRVSLCIDDRGSNRRVLVKGEATVVEEPNVGGAWVPIAERMSRRYLGERGPEYLKPTLGEPRWLLYVRPLTITTWQGVDWAPRYKHGQW